MSARSVWDGLADSALLADLDAREGSPRVILLTLAGGLGLYFLVGVCVWCLLLAPITLFGPHAGEGLEGLTQAWLDLGRPGQGSALSQGLSLAVITAVNAAPLFACAAFAAAMAQHKLHTYATAAPRFRWRLLLLGLGLSLLVLIPGLAAERILSPEATAPVASLAADLPAEALYMAAALLIIPAALAEELVFRGWFLRLTATVSRRPAALVSVSSVVFAAAHFSFRPAAADADAFIRLALMGAGWAYMTLRLGGLEFAAGSHAANNLLIVLFLHPLDADPPATQGGPIELLTDLALVAGYVVITEGVVRSPYLRRLSGVRAREISPPDAAEHGA